MPQQKKYLLGLANILVILFLLIGGQLFSKSLRGLTNYKMEMLGIEGLLVAIFFLVLSLIILYIFISLFPHWKEPEVELET